MVLQKYFHWGSPSEHNFPLSCPAPFIFLYLLTTVTYWVEFYVNKRSFMKMGRGVFCSFHFPVFSSLFTMQVGFILPSNPQSHCLLICGGPRPNPRDGRISVVILPLCTDLPCGHRPWLDATFELSQGEQRSCCPLRFLQTRLESGRWSGERVKQKSYIQSRPQAPLPCPSSRMQTCDDLSSAVDTSWPCHQQAVIKSTPKGEKFRGCPSGYFPNWFPREKSHPLIILHKPVGSVRGEYWLDTNWEHSQGEAKQGHFDSAMCSHPIDHLPFAFPKTKGRRKSLHEGCPPSPWIPS